MNKIFLLFGLLLLHALPALAQKPVTFGSTHRDFGGSHSVANTMGINFMLGGFSLGYGLGGEYERAFGSEGKFSAHLPFAFSKSNDVPLMSSADNGDRYHYYTAYYVAPGFRFHPTGNEGSADFSFGLQLAVGSVKVREVLIGALIPETNISSMFLAPMADLNLNIISKDGFLFGMYVGGGPVIAGEFGTTSKGTSNNSQGFFQTGIKLGGRF